MLMYAVVVTDDRAGTLEAMAPLFGLTPDEVAALSLRLGGLGRPPSPSDLGCPAGNAGTRPYLVVQGADAMLRRGRPSLAPAHRLLTPVWPTHRPRWGFAGAGWVTAIHWHGRSGVFDDVRGSDRSHPATPSTWPGAPPSPAGEPVGYEDLPGRGPTR